MRRQGMDAGDASIIVDRCRPPQGLASAPYTLKAVLWCLRGLGAPGADICVHAEVIESRTCLGERAVRKAIATLREQGVLEQVQAQAPGRPAAYRMHYARIAEWLDPEDRARVRLPSENDPNSGTRCRRSPAPDAGEHRHEVPESDQHRHLVPATPASGAGVPIRIAGASCKTPAVRKQPPQRTGQDRDEQRSGQPEHAAAAAAISPGEWEDLGRQAGLEPALAAQCAAELARRAWADLETGLVALERLSERLATEGVRNPTGLFVTILTRPGGPEPSKRSIKRAKSEDARRRRYLAALTPRQVAELAKRVAEVMPDSGLATERGVWLVDPSGPDFHAARARDAIWARWDEIEALRVSPRVAVPA